MEEGAIVLIGRRYPPLGWALPGGFVELVRQFHTYSDPARDPRGHTVSTVFVGRGRGTPRARDDARDIAVFRPDDLPRPLAFDHERILADYFAGRY
jgi:8-oxo-dGTP diphosphatase